MSYEVRLRCGETVDVTNMLTVRPSSCVGKNWIIIWVLHGSCVNLCCVQQRYETFPIQQLTKVSK
jgi:hypothetical protein